MSEQIKIVMAQINPIVGDIDGNVHMIIEAAQQAKQQHEADIVVFPELTITGYPPEDLLFRQALYIQVDAALSTICEAVQDVVVVIGYPMMDDLGERFNMAAWIEKGQIQASYIKQNLPNYSVFDEKRYFESGDQSCVVTYKGVSFGLLICEDIWKISPASQAVASGAEALLILNASPFFSEKHQDRIDVVKRRISEVSVPVIYVNQIGGQDELVFDGGSFATCAEGEVQVQAPEFKEALTPVTLLKQGNSVAIMPGEQAELYEDEARVYQALVMGVRDYIQKNGFNGALLGLSGGIDSALTLAIAVDALGADKVEAVMMPFRYTADISIEDAKLEADALGVHYHSIPIEDMYNAFESALATRFEGYEPDLTEENLQARIRGTVLMSISNKVGKLVLATSNKSEVAVGYSTLYGDMVGGFSPLKDVPKTLVYRLSKYRNTLSQVIPERVITRPPSAELRPDQKDQDSLPDYDILDSIIENYVKYDKSPTQIVEEFGFEAKQVESVVRMINRSEYKRRQAAPGVKITKRAFGRDRRYPITNQYRE
ncbi:NAD+ synthase [Hydrogenovibrio marinus]|uniref:Glutamine-dependent NAD(+) synthetase n=1 Tax=Hydrogenovibrio marinus TaxID=28885 RepID=A0A066ZRL1_HYDMR|nr:NAD+ synthase [Hydrogenovibrio marinus]KDN94914.1 NAD synthetase [Hydrogenovibrio marinus]BBN59378.1 NAD+ synthase [Hydrogenovibrio marinus]